MGFIINLAAKIGGIARLWGFLDGYKTKIAGVASLLSGAAGIVAALIPIIEAKDAAALWAFVSSLPANPAWILMLGGLGALGIGHKLDKAADPTPVKP